MILKRVDANKQQSEYEWRDHFLILPRRCQTPTQGVYLWMWLERVSRFYYYAPGWEGIPVREWVYATVRSSRIVKRFKS